MVCHFKQEWNYDVLVILKSKPWRHVLVQYIAGNTTWPSVLFWWKMNPLISGSVSLRWSSTFEIGQCQPTNPFAFRKLFFFSPTAVKRCCVFLYKCPALETCTENWAASISMSYLSMFLFLDCVCLGLQSRSSGQILVDIYSQMHFPQIASKIYLKIRYFV